MPLFEKIFTIDLLVVAIVIGTMGRFWGPVLYPIYCVRRYSRHHYHHIWAESRQPVNADYFWAGVATMVAFVIGGLVYYFAGSPLFTYMFGVALAVLVIAVAMVVRQARLDMSAPQPMYRRGDIN